MIRRWEIAFFSLFLTACTAYSPQFNLPKQVSFDGVVYIKVTDNQLDEMRQLLYLPIESEKNPNDWQQGILFFLDKNTSQQSLETRLMRRQKLFDKQPNWQAKLNIIRGELHSEVIYPPTEHFRDTQLELSRGRNLACGFGQIQFSEKFPVSANSRMTTQNSVFYSKEIAKLAIKFIQLPWLIECK